MNEADVITQSALAAVASSRRSPLGHRRSALPREFRSDLVEDVPSSKRNDIGSYDTRRTSPVGDKRESIRVREQILELSSDLTMQYV